MLVKWEYLFVVCEHLRGDWRPQFVNGQELNNWQHGPTIYEYSNQLGQQGWELVNLVTGHNDEGSTLYYRLVFKRPAGKRRLSHRHKETQEAAPRPLAWRKV